MKRRAFLKSATAAVGGLAMPYLLPSGRLLARTQDVKAQHVILVLFAGGVRQQEAIGHRYLEDSQGEPFAGNILYNLMEGEPPIDKIVYGTDGNRPGERPITRLLDRSLQRQGTLMAEMRTDQVAHYNGLNVCLQGNYTRTQGLKQQPELPTVFEYVRRHTDFPPDKVWFIGSGIGNSIPLLSHSTHPDYGATYGANFLAPSMTFSQKGFEELADARVYHPEFELSPMEKLTWFLNQGFTREAQQLTGLANSSEEQYRIELFLKEMFRKTQEDQISMPVVRDNPDLRTIGYTCEVLRHFKPHLTVVNMDNVDVCHGNFTAYLRNLHRADHAVGFLWDFIHTQLPEMAAETILLVAPECGRNLLPNPIRDENNWFSYDHSDENALRVFGLMAGKSVPANLRIGRPDQPIGMTADLVPTVADILGIKDTVMQSGFLRPGAMSWFDRL